MKKIMGIVIVLALTVGCATISKENSKNYMEKGMAVYQLKGHKYYYASGEVNLYLAGLVPTRKVETSVALLVDENTGEILKIKTLQPAGRETATARTTGDVNATTYITGGYKYRLGDLVGGISVYDIRYTDSWDEALLLVSKLATQVE